jgi:outer membrane lipoprotein LolB
LITLLCACATHKSPRNDTTDTLSGRLSVRIEGQPERGINAGFELTGSANEGTLVLSGPLGVSAAQARWNRGEAVLRAGDSETHFPDLQSLVEAALGEAIPLAALFDWLRGRPWSGAPMLVRTDGVAGFAQMGWQINLDRWAEGWIEARRDATPAITFRAKLEL